MKRVSEILMAVLFSVTLFGLMIATILLPKQRYSYYENRNLSEFPEISPETILSGKVFSDLETMFCDYAAGRTQMLKASTWCDLHLFHRPVINDVVVTDDVLLPYLQPETVDPAMMEQLAWEVAADNAAVQALVESYGGTYCYVAVPCQYAYHAADYPDYLYNRNAYTQLELTALTAAMEEQNVNFVDMGQVFDALGHPAEFSSAVDNHYGLRGAYETYRSAVNLVNDRSNVSLDFPAEGTDIQFETLPNPYMGSRTRKLLGLLDNDEHLLTARFTEDLPFTRQDNGYDVPSTVYTMPETDTEPVLYTFYMGGDVAETRLNTHRPNKPNGLIFGDSFTNAVECMAYYSFNETRSLDLRHYTEKSLPEYIRDYRPDVVICIRDYESLLSRSANGNLSEWEGTK